MSAVPRRWNTAATLSLALTASAGDLGYTDGVYAVTAAQNARPSETGDYLRIWRRDESGDWRVALDLTSPAQ